MLNGLGTDLRFAIRLLKRQPLMSVVALVSLTAGLGLNILLLTLADAALMRPLPLAIRSPGRASATARVGVDAQFLLSRLPGSAR